MSADTATAATDHTDGHPSGDDRFEFLDKAMRRARYSQDQLIEVLHVAQEVFGYLSEDVLLYVARGLRLPPSRVYGVSTFYHLFTFDPPGDHTATVCTGTACFVKGADAVVDALSREYRVVPGATTEDGRFTLKTARCLGSCGMAPVVVVDGEVRGNVQADAAVDEVADRLAATAATDGQEVS